MEPSVAGSSAAADTRPGEFRGRDAVCLWVCTPCCTPRPRTWHPSTWRTAPASAPASLARGALGVRAELKNAEAASRGGCSGQCVQGGDLLRMWSAGARIPHLHAASSGAVRSAAVWNAPRGHREKPVACLTGVARAVACSCCRFDAGAERGGRRELCGQHKVERQATSRAPGRRGGCGLRAQPVTDQRLHCDQRPCARPVEWWPVCWTGASNDGHH